MPELINCERCGDNGFLDESTLSNPIYCDCSAGSAMAFAAWVDGDRRAYTRVMRNAPVFVLADEDGHGHVVYEAYEKLPPVGGHVHHSHDHRMFHDGDEWGRIGSVVADLKPEGVTLVTWRRREHERAIAEIVDHDYRLTKVFYEEANGRITVRRQEIERVD